MCALLSAGCYALALQLVSYGAQLGIPFLSETAYERLTQELIYRHVDGLPLLAAVDADVPSVIVQRCQSVRQTFHADRVEGAGYWLHPSCLACTESLLCSAEAAVLYGAWRRLACHAVRGVERSVGLVGEAAGLAVHYTCHEVALLVGVCHALPVYHPLC